MIAGRDIVICLLRQKSRNSEVRNGSLLHFEDEILQILVFIGRKSWVMASDLQPHTFGRFFVCLT